MTPHPIQPESLGSRDAFTLIEVIAALVLIGFAAAILAVLVSRSITGGHMPRESLAMAFANQSAMESMIARHGVLDDVVILSGEIGTEGAFANSAFGRYEVVHNRFIAFDASDQEVTASTTNRLLKVSIRNAAGEIVTRLFSENG